MLKSLLTLFLLTYFLKSTFGLKCYSCSVGENDVDRSCVTNVEKMTIIDCNMKYCYTIRQDFQDPKNTVASISRTCMDDPPDPKNGIVEDGVTFRFYYTSCTEDLCNGGDGRWSTGSRQNALGDKSLIIAPGIDSSAFRPASIAYLSVFIVLLIKLVA